jgi:hypothetical protein
MSFKVLISLPSACERTKDCVLSHYNSRCSQVLQLHKMMAQQCLQRPPSITTPSSAPSLRKTGCGMRLQPIETCSQRRPAIHQLAHHQQERQRVSVCAAASDSNQFDVDAPKDPNEPRLQFDQPRDDEVGWRRELWLSSASRLA